MVAIGARVPQEDVEFISQLKIEGATTPSDKVRLIIAEARRRHDGLGNYDSCLEQMNQMLSQTSRLLRHAELETRTHSELLSRTLEWLPDVMAYLLASKKMLVSEEPGDMQALEEGVADRVFRLIESVLQMAVTRQCDCFDKDLITRRIPSVLDLARVIEVARDDLKRENQHD